MFLISNALNWFSRVFELQSFEREPGSPEILCPVWSALVIPKFYWCLQVSTYYKETLSSQVSFPEYFKYAFTIKHVQHYYYSNDSCPLGSGAEKIISQIVWKYNKFWSSVDSYLQSHWSMNCKIQKSWIRCNCTRTLINHLWVYWNLSNDLPDGFSICGYSALSCCKNIRCSRHCFFKSTSNWVP